MNGCKVLVVEDDDLIRFTIAEELEDAGFFVSQATNVTEAVMILRIHSDIRAIFTDIDMPGQLDGLQLAAIVHDRWPPVRILVASGRDFVAKADLPLDGRFFAKPYSRGCDLEPQRNASGSVSRHNASAKSLWNEASLA